MSFEYRKVEESDLEGLKILLKNNFDVEINNVSNDNNQYSLVAVCNDKIVGHLLFTRIYNPIKNIYYGKIDYVCVDENYRGNHVATSLLKEIESIENTINYFELTSNKRREIANQLYLKNGYSIVDTNLFRKFINN